MTIIKIAMMMMMMIMMMKAVDGKRMGCVQPAVTLLM